MAASINERFLDFQVAQAIRWIRFGNGQMSRAMQIMSRVDAELKRILLDPPGGEYTQARLKALQLQISNLMTAIHDQEVKPLILEIANTVSTTSKEIEQEALKRILPAGLDVTTPNPGILQNAATLRPFNGAVLGDWIEDLKRNDLNRVWRTVLDGIVSGTPTPDLIRSVVGSPTLRYKDGIREVSRRGIQALVRTSINHATNVGRQQVWEANSDIIKGVRWVSTLDMRTTPICRDRDGEIYKVNEGPRPPAHPNCRSTTVAVLKSWKELGFDMDELDEPTRASMDGQVPGKLTYWDWFKRQSGEVQKEVLGPTRYGMWKRGEVGDPTEFTNDRGRLYTLAELKNKTRSTQAVVDPDADDLVNRSPDYRRLTDDERLTLYESHKKIPGFLAEHENSLLSRFTVNEYKAINAAIRSKSVDAAIKSKIADLEQLFVKVDKDYLLYRGINKGNDFLPTLKVGQVFDSGGFTSWSRNSNIARNFAESGLGPNYVLKVIARGGKTKALITNASEAEFILGPGVKFRIVSITNVSSVRSMRDIDSIIEVEIIEP